jgi:hypothetical protein
VDGVHESLNVTPIPLRWETTTPFRSAILIIYFDGQYQLYISIHSISKVHQIYGTHGDGFLDMLCPKDPGAIAFAFSSWIQKAISSLDMLNEVNQRLELEVQEERDALDVTETQGATAEQDL